MKEVGEVQEMEERRVKAIEDENENEGMATRD